MEQNRAVIEPVNQKEILAMLEIHVVWLLFWSLGGFMLLFVMEHVGRLHNLSIRPTLYVEQLELVWQQMGRMCGHLIGGLSTLISHTEGIFVTWADLCRASLRCVMAPIQFFWGFQGNQETQKTQENQTRKSRPTRLFIPNTDQETLLLDPTPKTPLYPNTPNTPKTPKTSRKYRKSRKSI